MSIKTKKKQSQFGVVFLIYLILVVAVSIILYVLINQLLVKFKTIPVSVRAGYVNPYSSYLGISAGFILVTIIIYEIIDLWLQKKIPITMKVLIGLLSGFLPVAVLQISTFGISFPDPAICYEMAIFSLSGGLIPILKHQLLPKTTDKD